MLRKPEREREREVVRRFIFILVEVEFRFGLENRHRVKRKVFFTKR